MYVCVCVCVCVRQVRVRTCTHAHPNSRTHLQEQVGMPLLCHGESTDPCSDVFDREAKWVREVRKIIFGCAPVCVHMSASVCVGACCRLSPIFVCSVSASA